MFAPMSVSHQLYGKVVKTVGSREEAEKAKGTGKNHRVVQVTGDLTPGHWVSPGETVAELVRGLPPNER
jgi:hypothetical protein